MKFEAFIGGFIGNYILLSLIFAQFYVASFYIDRFSSYYGVDVYRNSFKGILRVRWIIYLIMSLIGLSLIIGSVLLFINGDDSILTKSCTYFTLCLVYKGSIIINSIIIMSYVLSEYVHQDKEIRQMKKSLED